MEAASPEPDLYAGNPKHPAHEAYLTELGRAVLGAAFIAGHLVEILAVYRPDGYHGFATMDLGTLVRTLRQAADDGFPIPELEVLLEQVEAARETRNRLMHALPALQGLHGRSRVNGETSEFFTIDDLRRVVDHFEEVRGIANPILRAVRASAAGKVL